MKSIIIKSILCFAIFIAFASCSDKIQVELDQRRKTLTFSVYFRNNPISANTLDNEANRFSVIGSILPAITYNFKF